MDIPARYKERHRMTRDKVKSCIENFVARTTSGDAKAEEIDRRIAGGAVCLLRILQRQNDARR
jgi:hypothetical protein